MDGFQKRMSNENGSATSLRVGKSTEQTVPRPKLKMTENIRKEQTAPPSPQSILGVSVGATPPLKPRRRGRKKTENATSHPANPSTPNQTRDTDTGLLGDLKVVLNSFASSLKETAKTTQETIGEMKAVRDIREPFSLLSPVPHIEESQSESPPITSQVSNPSSIRETEMDDAVRDTADLQCLMSDERVFVRALREGAIDLSLGEEFKEREGERGETEEYNTSDNQQEAKREQDKEEEEKEEKEEIGQGESDVCRYYESVEEASQSSSEEDNSSNDEQENKILGDDVPDPTTTENDAERVQEIHIAADSASDTLTDEDSLREDSSPMPPPPPPMGPASQCHNWSFTGRVKAPRSTLPTPTRPPPGRNVVAVYTPVTHVPSSLATEEHAPINPSPSPFPTCAYAATSSSFFQAVIGAAEDDGDDEASVSNNDQSNNIASLLQVSPTPSPPVATGLMTDMSPTTLAECHDIAISLVKRQREQTAREEAKEEKQKIHAGGQKCDLRERAACAESAMESNGVTVSRYPSANTASLTTNTKSQQGSKRVSVNPFALSPCLEASSSPPRLPSCSPPDTPAMPSHTVPASRTARVLPVLVVEDEDKSAVVQVGMDGEKTCETNLPPQQQGKKVAGPPVAAKPKIKRKKSSNKGPARKSRTPSVKSKSALAARKRARNERRPCRSTPVADGGDENGERDPRTGLVRTGRLVSSVYTPELYVLSVTLSCKVVHIITLSCLTARISVYDSDA